MMKIILLSIGIITIIATIIGIGVYFINPDLVLPTVLVFMGTMWAVDYIYSIKDRPVPDVITEHINTPPEVLVNLECEYCKVPSDVSVDLTSDNKYKCPACDNINDVIITFNTVRNTTPIITNPIVGGLNE